MTFDQFKPSKQFLEKICKDEGDLATLYFVIPIKKETSERSIEDTLAMVTLGMYNVTAEYYRWGLNIKENMHTQKFGGLAVHALENSIVHGSKEGDIVIDGLFLGTEGLCHGFRDCGDYFKSEEIKRMFENRVTISSSGVETHISGCGIGVDGIYEYADEIQVDTKKGILYCLQYKKNLARNKECMSYRDRL